MKNLTYKDAGVDIQGMDSFKGRIRSLVRRSFRPEVLKDIGGFGSFFSFPKHKYKHPVLVSSSDGVGTKLKIAIISDKHDTVGIDAVAMNVNDILCTGAEPLFFLDYISFSKLKQHTLFSIVKGINSGCIKSGCSLIGGETAQMPGMYKPGEYDIAGFCVGVVERQDIIDGSWIRSGDAVIGIESSGLHSNGYSLVRKVFSQEELKRLSGELLKPTRIYAKEILAVLDALNNKKKKCIHGIAHITGGAFFDKISRILPKNVNARINKYSWEAPKIFKLIQNKGNISDREIYHTLNMGIGLVLVVDKQSLNNVILQLSGVNLKSWVIGEIVPGNKKVEIV